MLDGVAEDLPLESEPDASDKFSEPDGDWKNLILGALVMESCLLISIMWLFFLQENTMCAINLYVYFIHFSHLSYMSIIP